MDRAPLFFSISVVLILGALPFFSMSADGIMMDPERDPEWQIWEPFREAIRQTGKDIWDFFTGGEALNKTKELILGDISVGTLFEILGIWLVEKVTLLFYIFEDTFFVVATGVLETQNSLLMFAYGSVGFNYESEVYYNERGVPVRTIRLSEGSELVPGGFWVDNTEQQAIQFSVCLIIIVVELIVLYFLLQVLDELLGMVGFSIPFI